MKIYKVRLYLCCILSFMLHQYFTKTITFCLFLIQGSQNFKIKQIFVRGVEFLVLNYLELEFL